MRLLPYLVFIFGYYVVRAVLLLPAGHEFYLTILNVGQGDSIVIHSPDYGPVMVDTGYNYQANYLSARRSVFPICQLKTVIITHYDRDHVGGLDRVLRYCPETAVADNLARGDLLTLGSTRLEVLSPAVKNLSHEENDDSIVVLLTRKDFTALLTGDAGTAVLESALSGLEIYVDVYKVSHHGSKYNTSLGLLQKLRPKICVIPVGRNNFGHPSPDVLRDLELVGCTTLRTDLDGTIVLY